MPGVSHATLARCCSSYFETGFKAAISEQATAQLHGPAPKPTHVCSGAPPVIRV